MKTNKLKTTEEYLLEVLKKYGDTYDLSKVSYVNAKTKVTVGCRTCGDFQQEASYFVSQSLGCPTCARILKNSGICSTLEFIDKARKVHGGKYDYSFVSYTRSRNKVKISCKIHGIFEQTPNNHLRNRGCNSCRLISSSSDAERALATFLETLEVGVIRNYRPGWLLGKEIDIYVPSLGLAIEYNGFVYHHSTEGDLSPFLASTKVPDDYHLNKYDLCKAHGISLVHIFEFEDLLVWQDKLSWLVSNPSSYQVTFTNSFQSVKMYNKTLHFYGNSNIIASLDK